MSADTRPVTTDALETLGGIISANEKRDAIHLAVEPATAGEKLSPGEHVSFKDGVAHGTAVYEGVGIVDPFLKRPVKQGEMFWLVVYPRKITSLRHVWEHPDFAVDAQPKRDISRSEQYIRDLADSVGISYKRLLDGARDSIEYGNYITGGDEMEGTWTPEEFWIHYEIVTNTKVPDEKQNNFFSCSC